MTNITLGRAKFWSYNRRMGKTEVFTGRVIDVEDKGDYLYIGYEPDDKHCKFGYRRFYKEETNHMIQRRIEMI